MQLQLLFHNTKGRSEILFGKHACIHLNCWQDYTNRVVYIKEQMISLEIEKAIQIPPEKTTQITLLPKYTRASYQQDKSIIPNSDCLSRKDYFCQSI